MQEMEPKTESGDGTDAAVKREQQPGSETSQTVLERKAADEAMTEYERKRLGNIQRNLEYMKSVGMSTVCASGRCMNSSAAIILTTVLLADQDGGAYVCRATQTNEGQGQACHPS